MQSSHSQDAVLLKGDRGIRTGDSHIKELCDEAGVCVEHRRTTGGILIAFHRNDVFTGMVPMGPPYQGKGTDETVSGST